jgi:hypothetical protein
VRIEHTVDFHRKQVPAVVAERPFFDPERKKFTPKTPKKEAARSEAQPSEVS